MFRAQASGWMLCEPGTLEPRGPPWPGLAEHAALLTGPWAMEVLRPAPRFQSFLVRHSFPMSLQAGLWFSGHSGEPGTLLANGTLSRGAELMPVVCRAAVPPRMPVGVPVSCVGDPYLSLSDI